MFSEVVVQRCSKEGFLKISQNLEENTCAGVSFYNRVEDLGPASIFEKETPTLVFFCEFCKIYKNNFFIENLRWLLRLELQLLEAWK